ncbi:hypothetical protein DH2020_038423 [Rehmannia glutinosa]|uniref:Peptidase M16 C-terminal domain-containing protein n=1 Tax=Rehmannia glutinosa TaxID=99300 RepID=A0ABR0UYY4_REHGL
MMLIKSGNSMALVLSANATLYIVGDIDNISETVNHIEAVFGQTGTQAEASIAPTQVLLVQWPASLKAKALSVEKSKNIRKERHAVRPPVQHDWSIPGSYTDAKPPRYFSMNCFRISQLICSARSLFRALSILFESSISLCLYFNGIAGIFLHTCQQGALTFLFCWLRCKESTVCGFLKYIMVYCYEFKSPFTSVELDHSDSGREGCTVTTLTVTAEPQNWRNAIKVAVQEVRRLKEFGVTNGELARYLDALLKDSEQLAAMIDNVSSVDNLDFIMESDALGHTVMDQRQGHESLVAVVGTVTLEEVNSIGAEVLEFLSDYGKPTAPHPAAIVACVPKKVHIDGIGETDFKIEPEEILAAIEAGLKEPIEAEPELEIPKELISSEQLQELRLQIRPSFVPVDQEKNLIKVYDEDTGIIQRRLSNGIPVNYKISKNEANCGVMRLIVGGGRAAESAEAKGSVIVGVRTLSEGGRGELLAQKFFLMVMVLGIVVMHNFCLQVELFCVNHLINCSLESTEEFISMEFRFTLRDDGMRAAFQLLHMVLEASTCCYFLMFLEEYDSLVLVRLVSSQSPWTCIVFGWMMLLIEQSSYTCPITALFQKSLERSTAHKLMLAMLDGDERFVEPTPHSLQQLTLEQVKDAVMNQFVSDNMEVSIVGDFSEEDIESCILEYLGTVKERRGSERLQKYSPIIFRPYTADLQHQQVFLKDTDERACAYIAGPAPNRWGFTFEGKNLLESISNVSAFGEFLQYFSSLSMFSPSCILGAISMSQVAATSIIYGFNLAYWRIRIVAYEAFQVASAGKTSALTLGEHVKFEEQPGELETAEKSLQGELRAHPLFFAITMGLLQEIINSRLFTTVRDSLGLTYDVSFELNLFDRLKLGWYVISVTSTPEKVHKAVDACKNVLRGLQSNRIAPRELDRARRTLLMRHEAEIKSNAYWLGLMAHLQATSVPRKDISCIKDLISLYEAATVEDVYIAYEQLKIDENSLYSCIGVAGSQAGEVAASVIEEELVEGLHNVIPMGRGSSTMTRPTT